VPPRDRTRVQLGFLLAGCALLIVTIWDALATTIAPDSGGGVVTSRMARGIWFVAERFARRPGSLMLRSTGPVISVLTAGAWLLGLWLGWFLVLSASPESVLDRETLEVADAWSRLYFAGFTVFTLGVGDKIPAGPVAQMATVFGAISGLAFTTLAITFLLPVVTAVTQRRQQANRIAGLGDDAQAIVVNGWDGSGFTSLERILSDLAGELLLTAERRLAYPILAYFHAAAVPDDHRVQLAAIDEAATLLQHGVDHAAVGVQHLPLRLVRHAVVQQLERAATPVPGSDHARPLTLDLAPLREAGIPTVDDATFDAAVAADEAEVDHRSRLAALLASTRWDGPVGARTRPS
jgi:hypothetical protein